MGDDSDVKPATFHYFAPERVGRVERRRTSDGGSIGNGLLRSVSSHGLANL